MITTKTIDGITYHLASAIDGWPTGPCLTADALMLRLSAYESGADVTEAAPGQASRAQMAAFLAWARDAGFRDGGQLVRQIEQAIADGLHSDAWIRASRELGKMARQIPSAVLMAGSAAIRRIGA